MHAFQDSPLRLREYALRCSKRVGGQLHKSSLNKIETPNEDDLQAPTTRLWLLSENGGRMGTKAVVIGDLHSPRLDYAGLAL